MVIRFSMSLIPQSFVVLPQGLFCVSEISPGWEVLIDSDNGLVLARRSLRNQTTPQKRLDFLQKIGTRGAKRDTKVRLGTGRLLLRKPLIERILGHYR